MRVNGLCRWSFLELEMDVRTSEEGVGVKA